MSLRSFLAEICSLPDPKVLLYDEVGSEPTSLLPGGVVVFVGCGRWDTRQASPAPVVLQNKGSKIRFSLDQDYTSLTQMLALRAPEILQNWSARPSAPLGPAQASPRFTIVAEDASPDAVFGYLLFLAAVAGIATDKFFPDWADAVDEWERHGNCGDPRTSWCALESALAHRRIPMKGDVTVEELGKAWGDCLRFAGACLHGYLPPEALPKHPLCEVHGFALAALEQERQAYQQWLQHSAIVQLSLPLVGANDRRLIVDALFVDEDQMTGSAKIFYRNDTQNSPLQRGFALAVHHRAGSSESNPDITIDLDPRCGVHLQELHKALETAERMAWDKKGEKRSVSNARYMENVPNVYEQPWYMDREHTIIGSPRRLRSGGYGSRLSRDAVFNLVWNTCEPLRGISVSSFDGDKPVAITELNDALLSEGSHRKRLFLARWLKGGEQTFRTLPDAPTVWRMLASRTIAQEPSTSRTIEGENVDGPQEVASLSALPLSGEYDRVSLHGGMAIVTEEGAFVLDDWTWHSLDLTEMKAVFVAAEALDQALEARSAELSKLSKQLSGYLDASASISEVNSLILDSARLSTKISALRGSHAVPPSQANGRAFQLALSHRWAIDKRLDDLEKQLFSQQVALRNLLDSGTSSLTRRIATVGFAGGLAATMAAPVAKAWYFRRPWDVHPDPPPLQFFIVFLLITSLACGITLLFFKIVRLITRPDARPRNPSRTNHLGVNLPKQERR